jgi:hypothetical protein
VQQQRLAATALEDLAPRSAAARRPNSPPGSSRSLAVVDEQHEQRRGADFVARAGERSHGDRVAETSGGVITCPPAGHLGAAAAPRAWSTTSPDGAAPVGRATTERVLRLRAGDRSSWSRPRRAGAGTLCRRARSRSASPAAGAARRPRARRGASAAAAAPSGWSRRPASSTSRWLLAPAAPSLPGEGGSAAWRISDLALPSAAGCTACRCARPSPWTSLAGRAGELWLGPAAPAGRTAGAGAPPAGLLLLIGPEGGLDAGEQAAAPPPAAGAFGRTTLRVETASLALAVLALASARPAEGGDR